jgi:hypothetical protein
MNITKAVIAAAIVLALAVPARSQVKYGGYLAAEYIDGQTDSLYPHGSIQNLLAGFLAKGSIAQGFGFAVEVRALDVDSFDMNQAWAGYMPSKSFSVRAGLYLVPFGGWNAASRPHETLLVRTPLNLEYLYPQSWRDLGVVIEGQTGFLSYAAYFGNGLAEGGSDAAPYFPYVQQFHDNNTDKAKGGRVGIVAGQSIRAGYSYYTGKYDDQDMRDLTLEGADFSWVTAQWEFHGEYTWSYIENPAPYERGKSEGWSIWACSNIRGFQPVGSYQEIKLKDTFHYGDIPVDRSRWTAGLRYVVNNMVFLKFEYDWNSETGLQLKDDQWQVQVAVSF